MLHEGDLLAERYQALTRIHDEPALGLYEGEDLRSGKGVVLAALRGETALDPRLPAQLKRLAAATRPRSHPHVAGILAVEDAGTSKVVVFERPEGESLDTLLRHRRLPQHLAVQIALHATEALAYLHARGIVHGALAPQWIVVATTPRGVDACALGAGLALLQPRIGLGPDAAPFAAPERKRGADPLPQSDVYSLGALLQRMTTGDALSAPTQPPPGTTDPLQRVLRRCLAPRVEERLTDAEHLLGLLKRDVSHLATAPPEPVEDDRPEPGVRIAATPPPTRPQSPPVNATMAIPATSAERAPKPIGARRRSEPSPSLGGRRTHPIASLLCALILPALLAWYPYRLYVNWVAAAPDDVVVPTVVGKSESDARDELKRRGLRLAIVDEVFDPDIPEGEIVWARPVEGSVVKEGRQVRARISRGKRAVVVPDITRLNLDAARKRLEEVGLSAEITTRAPSDVVAKDAVISQIPKAGRKLREGGTVQVMVSDGEAEGAPSPAKSPASKLETKAATVSFEVPQGASSQRVRIRVSDETQSGQIVYDGLHEPGDRVNQAVEGKGATHVAVLLDEQVIEEQDL